MPKLPDAVLGSYVFTDATLKSTNSGISHICIEYTKSKGAKERTLHAVASDGHQIIHLSWISDLDNVIPEGVMPIPHHIMGEVLNTVLAEVAQYQKDRGIPEEPIDNVNAEDVCDQCNGKGWDFFEETSTDRIVLQRCDQCQKYETDQAAAIVAEPLLQEFAQRKTKILST